MLEILGSLFPAAVLAGTPLLLALWVRSSPNGPATSTSALRA